MNANPHPAQSRSSSANASNNIFGDMRAPSALASLPASGRSVLAGMPGLNHTQLEQDVRRTSEAVSNLQRDSIPNNLMDAARRFKSAQPTNIPNRPSTNSVNRLQDQPEQRRNNIFATNPNPQRQAVLPLSFNQSVTTFSTSNFQSNPQLSRADNSNQNPFASSNSRPTFNIFMNQTNNNVANSSQSSAANSTQPITQSQSQASMVFSSNYNPNQQNNTQFTQNGNYTQESNQNFSNSQNLGFNHSDNFNENNYQNNNGINTNIFNQNSQSGLDQQNQGNFRHQNEFSNQYNQPNTYQGLSFNNQIQVNNNMSNQQNNIFWNQQSNQQINNFSNQQNNFSNQQDDPFANQQNCGYSNNFNASFNNNQNNYSNDYQNNYQNNQQKNYHNNYQDNYQNNYQSNYQNNYQNCFQNNSSPLHFNFFDNNVNNLQNIIQLYLTPLKVHKNFKISEHFASTPHEYIDSNSSGNRSDSSPVPATPVKRLHDQNQENLLNFKRPLGASNSTANSASGGHLDTSAYKLLSEGYLSSRKDYTLDFTAFESKEEGSQKRFQGR